MNKHGGCLRKALLKDVLELYSRRITFAIAWKIAAEMEEEGTVMGVVEAGRPDWSLMW